MPRLDENEKILIFQMAELTIKDLAIAPKISSAKDDTEAKTYFHQPHST